MDQHRFDDLTRALAAGRSRRNVLKILGGLTAGLGAGAVGRRAVSAQDDCIADGAACELDEECCAGICCAGFCRDVECCIDEEDPNARCAEGETCFEGVCEAPGCTPEGEACESDDECCDGICCAGFCRNIECCIDEADPNARCPEGTSCFEGVCDVICQADSECDGDACCCPDGTCDTSCCAGGPTLPSTGAGAGAGTGDNGLMAGAALAAGAAALIAGKRLRQTPPSRATDA